MVERLYLPAGFRKPKCPTKGLQGGVVGNGGPETFAQALSSKYRGWNSSKKYRDGYKYLYL